MQISDMMGQYNRNVTNGTEELQGAQGVQKLVSTVSELSAGSIFEGTVNTIKNGRVVLGLGNGQVIAARLDAKIDVKPGSSMFFQVKSNDGTTVAIRPYTGTGNASNPILLNALTAAGIPVTERSIAMVDAMMKEQLSIGRNSILDMVKVAGNQPNVNIQTLVQMTKLGIPVTEEMAAQFENYMTDRHAVLGEMELAIHQITNMIGNEEIPAQDAFSLYSQILDILKSEGNQGTFPQSANGQELQNTIGTDANGQISADMQEGQIKGAADSAVQSKQPQDSSAAGLAQEVQNAETLQNMTADGQTKETVKQALAGAGVLPEQAVEAGLSGKAGQETLARLLDEGQLSNLTKLLKNVPMIAGNPDLFTDAIQEEVFVDTMSLDEPAALLANEQILQGGDVLNKNLTAGKFLDAVRDALHLALTENNQLGLAGMQKLFSGKEFKLLLREVMEQQWMIKPQELKEGNKISGLYEKMEGQLRQMESAMKLAGVNQSTFAQAAADIRGNIDFMNQINQIYTYVQVPLKLTGQNANGELYVYTNKKQLSDPDAELTAFLHLDLENLGSTDASVKMRNRKVQTNFYLTDDASYQLLEKHLPVLEKRLNKKGYSCTFTVTNQEKKVDFVEDFLKKDRPSAGKLHRYSFDVKA